MSEQLPSKYTFSLTLRFGLIFSVLFWGFSGFYTLYLGINDRVFTIFSLTLMALSIPLVYYYSLVVLIADEVLIMKRWGFQKKIIPYTTISNIRITSDYIIIEYKQGKFSLHSQIKNYEQLYKALAAQSERYHISSPKLTLPFTISVSIIYRIIGIFVFVGGFYISVRHIYPYLIRDTLFLGSFLMFIGLFMTIATTREYTFYHDRVVDTFLFRTKVYFVEGLQELSLNQTIASRGAGTVTSLALKFTDGVVFIHEASQNIGMPLLFTTLKEAYPILQHPEQGPKYSSS